MDESGKKIGLLPAMIKAHKTGAIVNLSSFDGSLPNELVISATDRCWGDQIHRVCIVPVAPITKTGVRGLAVLGVNPRRLMDDALLLFAKVLQDCFSSSLALVNLPEQQRRQQLAFAEIERSLNHRLRVSTLQSERLEENFTRMAQSAPIGMVCITHLCPTASHLSS